MSVDDLISKRYSASPSNEGNRRSDAAPVAQEPESLRLPTTALPPDTFIPQVADVAGAAVERILSQGSAIAGAVRQSMDQQKQQQRVMEERAAQLQNAIAKSQISSAFKDRMSTAAATFNQALMLPGVTLEEASNNFDAAIEQNEAWAKEQANTRFEPTVGGRENLFRQEIQNQYQTASAAYTADSQQKVMAAKVARLSTQTADRASKILTKIQQGDMGLVEATETINEMMAPLESSGPAARAATKLKTVLINEAKFYQGVRLISDTSIPDNLEVAQQYLAQYEGAPEHYSRLQGMLQSAYNSKAKEEEKYFSELMSARLDSTVNNVITGAVGQEQFDTMNYAVETYGTLAQKDKWRASQALTQGFQDQVASFSRSSPSQRAAAIAEIEAAIPAMPASQQSGMRALLANLKDRRSQLDAQIDNSHNYDGFSPDQKVAIQMQNGVHPKDAKVLSDQQAQDFGLRIGQAFKAGDAVAVGNLVGELRSKPGMMEEAGGIPIWETALRQAADASGQNIPKTSLAAALFAADNPSLAPTVMRAAQQLQRNGGRLSALRSFAKAQGLATKFSDYLRDNDEASIMLGSVNSHFQGVLGPDQLNFLSLAEAVYITAAGESLGAGDSPDAAAKAGGNALTQLLESQGSLVTEGGHQRGRATNLFGAITGGGNVKVGPIVAPAGITFDGDGRAAADNVYSHISALVNADKLMAPTDAPRFYKSAKLPAGLQPRASEIKRGENWLGAYKQNASRHGIEPILQRKAKEAGVDPNIIRAIITIESQGRPGLTSPTGAQGIAQLMPDTVKWLKDSGRANITDPNDTEQAIEAAAAYVKHLQKDKGITDLAVIAASYNAGQNNTDVQKAIASGKYTGIKETDDYVNRFVGAYNAHAKSSNTSHLKSLREGFNAGTAQVQVKAEGSALRPYIMQNGLAIPLTNPDGTPAYIPMTAVKGFRRQ